MNRRVADFVFSNVKTREFTCVNDRSLNHAEKAEDAPLYSFWGSIVTYVTAIASAEKGARCALIFILGGSVH